MSTPSLINETQDLRIEHCRMFPDYLDLYSYLVELGKELPVINDDCEYIEMSGCQNKIYLGYWMSDGRMYFCGDSDSSIMRGVIMLLSMILSSHYPDEIAEADIYIFDRIGLKSNVSTLRQAGIDKIVETVKEMAKKEASKK